MKIVDSGWCWMGAQVLYMDEIAAVHVDLFVAGFLGDA